MPRSFQANQATITLKSLAVFAVALSTAGAALFDQAALADDFVVDTGKVGHVKHGVVSSDQMLELSTPTSSALRLEGEQAMRYNDINKAILVLQRAVEMSPSDIDGRVLYAEALEKKLTKQEERDPALFNFVVKQWLFVNKNSAFRDQAAQAAKHLKDLTGETPGRFESTTRYLTKVMVPEDGSQKVAFGHKKNEKIE